MIADLSVGFWCLGAIEPQRSGSRQFTYPVDRDYMSLVVYYLCTLRVCSGPQQTRYIVRSYGAAENLTLRALFGSCPYPPVLSS